MRQAVRRLILIFFILLSATNACRVSPENSDHNKENEDKGDIIDSWDGQNGFPMIANYNSEASQYGNLPRDFERWSQIALSRDFICIASEVESGGTIVMSNRKDMTWQTKIQFLRDKRIRAVVSDAYCFLLIDVDKSNVIKDVLLFSPETREYKSLKDSAGLMIGAYLRISHQNNTITYQNGDVILTCSLKYKQQLEASIIYRVSVSNDNEMHSMAYDGTTIEISRRLLGYDLDETEFRLCKYDVNMYAVDGTKNRIIIPYVLKSKVYILIIEENAKKRHKIMIEPNLFLPNIYKSNAIFFINIYSATYDEQTSIMSLQIELSASIKRHYYVNIDTGKVSVMQINNSIAHPFICENANVWLFQNGEIAKQKEAYICRFEICDRMYMKYIGNNNRDESYGASAEENQVCFVKYCNVSKAIKSKMTLPFVTKAVHYDSGKDIIHAICNDEGYESYYIKIHFDGEYAKYESHRLPFYVFSAKIFCNDESVYIVVYNAVNENSLWEIWRIESSEFRKLNYCGEYASPITIDSNYLYLFASSSSGASNRKIHIYRLNIKGLGQSSDVCIERSTYCGNCAYVVQWRNIYLLIDYMALKFVEVERTDIQAVNEIKYQNDRIYVYYYDYCMTMYCDEICNEMVIKTRVISNVFDDAVGSRGRCIDGLSRLY